MSKLYKIPSGGHSAKGLHMSLVIGNTLMRFKAKFYPNCIYTPQRVPEQISKLSGISYGLHHNCSARVGWRSDGSRIEVLSYVYTAHGQRSSQSLGFIGVDEWHEFKIRRVGTTVFLNMDNGQIQSFTLFKPRKIGYRLYPYFGGEIPAPHEMWIEVDILEMNGFGG